GRLVYPSYRGWGWVPGYEWGPAWVEWRSGNGYYGWAPMMPRVGVHVSVGIPINLWIFAPTRRIYARDIYRYSHIGRTNIYNRTTIINNTYIVNNRHYHGGPSRRDMERTIGRRIQVHNVSQSARPGASRMDKRTVSIYRPDRDNSRTASRRTGTTTREIRGNDRATSGRNSQSTTRRPETQSTAANRTTGNTRSTENRRPATNSRSTREMHIDRNGQATIKDNTSRTRSTENVNRNTPRSSERPAANRQTAQKQQSQAQRGSQRESRVQNNRSGQNNTRSSAPQEIGRAHV